LRYEQRGLGEPVLLVHGLYVGASHDEFRRNIAALAAHFRVFAIDLLGFGHSHAPRATHTPEIHHHLLRDFIIDVVGEKTAVVASGASAGIAVRLAVYDDPLVRRCSLICPSNRPDIHEQPYLSERVTQFLLGTLALGGGMYDAVSDRAALREFLRDRYANPDRAFDERTLDRLHEIARLPHSMYAYLSLLNHYMDVDVFRWLRYTRCPVQVIWTDGLGEPPRDRIFAPAQWSQGRRLDIVEGAKHWPHDERSAQVNRLLLEFLREETSSAG
jgi:pimeloyl-ACP methyl ester carboxylesterase